MTKEEIKEIRLAMGLTQEEFARKLGTVVATVSRWERGISSPLHIFKNKLKYLKKNMEGNQSLD